MNNELLFVAYEHEGEFIAARGAALERYLSEGGELDLKKLVAESLRERLRREALAEPGAWGLWLWRDDPTEDPSDWETAFDAGGELTRAAPEDLERLLGSELGAGAPDTDGPDRVFVVQPAETEQAPLVVGLSLSAEASPPYAEAYAPELEDTFAFLEPPALTFGLWVWQGRMRWVADLEHDDPDELFWPMREKHGRLDKLLGVVNGELGTFRRPTRGELTELVELGFDGGDTPTPLPPPPSPPPPRPLPSDRELQEAAREGIEAAARRERRSMQTYHIVSLAICVIASIWFLWATCG